MDIVRGLDALPSAGSRTAVTVGFFDGVHRGHQQVVTRTVEVAREGSLEPVAITFDRHPREVLTPGKAPKLLTTLDRKAELIGELEIERLVVLEFTLQFAAWPPETFVQRVLVDGLGAARMVVGSNFTFGHQASGTLATLMAMGPAFGFSAEGVSLLRVGDRPVSSSSIRASLAEGDLGWPKEALGRRFVLDGRVIPGAGRGAALLGFPTANLGVPERMLIPGRGVYAGKALAEGGAFVAAINVGTNPTFGEEPLHVEAYLLDFEGDLTGRPLSIEFWERLRDEERFDSAEALVAQMALDVERTRRAVSPGRSGATVRGVVP